MKISLNQGLWSITCIFRNHKALQYQSHQQCWMLPSNQVGCYQVCDSSFNWEFVDCVVLQTRDRENSHARLHYCLGLFLLASTVYNYILCIVTKPGFTCDADKEVSHSGLSHCCGELDRSIRDCHKITGGLISCLQVLEASVLQNWRYCKRCELPKPDLAHHCSVCNKWVYGRG